MNKIDKMAQQIELLHAGLIEIFSRKMTNDQRDEMTIMIKATNVCMTFPYEFRHKNIIYRLIKKPRPFIKGELIWLEKDEIKTAMLEFEGLTSEQIAEKIQHTISLCK